MWNIDAKRAVPHQWLDFEPDLVLDEYDGPMLFTLKDASLQKYLAYFCNRDDKCIRFLVAASSDSILTKLTAGDMDLRESLVNQSMWVFDLDKKWNPVRCWSVKLSDLPNNLLPLPGVMLRAHMQPKTEATVEKQQSRLPMP